MIDYNRVFEVACSNIPEEVKNLILDNMILENADDLYESLTEAEELGVHPIVECLDLLSNTASSSEVLESVIDELCENFDVDTIDAISEAYVELQARKAIMEREEIISELFGFHKSEDRKQAEAAVKARKESLKSAQASHNQIKNRFLPPIGMNAIRKEEIASNKVKAANTRYNKAKDSLSTLKKYERKEAIDNLKGNVKKFWGNIKAKGAQAVEKGKQALAKGARAVSAGATKVADKLEGKKPEATTPEATTTPTPVAAEVQPVKKRRGRPAGSKNKKTQEIARSNQRRDKILKKMKQPVHESIIEVVDMLACSTISNEALEEIVEMLVDDNSYKAPEVTLDNIQKWAKDRWSK